MTRFPSRAAGWTAAALLAVGGLAVAVGLALVGSSGSGAGAEAAPVAGAASPATTKGRATHSASQSRTRAHTARAVDGAERRAAERKVIRLLAGAFDPLKGELPDQPGIPLRSEATLPRSEPQYWLTQVRGERFADALRAVRTAGGAVVGALPPETYMVRATPTQRQRIERDGAVRWMGYYQPAWRVPVAAHGKNSLLSLRGERTYRISLFRDDPKLEHAARAIAAVPGVEIVEDAGAVIDVRATAKQIPALAAVPAVQWVGVKPRVVTHNVNARWVNDTGVRDVYAATAPGRLTGAGQTAAVADTGLNYTYDLNGRAHIGFRDCNADGTGCKTAIYTQAAPGNAAANINNVQNNSTNHRKVVAYFDIGSTGPNMYDESSHGSHTAGSVDGDQPPYNTYTGSDGLAPAAKHVHQNIATASGGLLTPTDDYDLWRQAYRPRNPAGVAETSGATGNPTDYSTDYRPLEDARTHNNSYGLLAPIIDEGSAVRLDRFVWDHEDMVIVVSAGNGGPSVGTIGSPSVAKNELSSGASANGRQPMVSIDSMAAFSSHGPTADNRFGVDLATPGQIVVSAKGGSTDGYHVAQGTSMSAPILTGLATLVRQYFWDGYARSGGDGFAAGAASPSRRHNPSAALVKAALINGAERMRGAYTGDEGSRNPAGMALDGQWPSAGQGFGRVNLDNSLYFANDPSNNWYQDVYRADATAFPVSNTSATRTYQLSVAAGQPLDVTLAWTDAPDLLPAGTPALVNNLDLTVTGPTALSYAGNNMNSRATPSVAVAETTPGPALPDVSNLTERVRIANPVAGTYTITVTAPAILFGNQGFALAASGRISPTGGPNFVAGPALQRDQAGSPTISNVRVETISADTARIFFDTNEPTTAKAELLIGATPTTFVDSYNVGVGGFTGLDEGPVETSAEYGDKPVVGTKHEILVTGLAPGQLVTATLKASDLAGTANETSQLKTFTSPRAVFQADADDIGQLYEDPASATAAQWKTGTQLYASDAADGAAALGAFAFRIPPASGIDPTTIVGAAVELTSGHDWVNRYTEDPIWNVDLLGSTIEAAWGTPTQTYSTIKNSSADARLNAETTHRRGNYTKYAFSLQCADLADLRTTLANGMAAFRWETQPANVGHFSMDFGFNRRSRGPTERPKLILFTADQLGYPDGRPCDPATPAPTIRDVGLHEGHGADTFTVSWETDVDSNSLVLFRKQGTTDWTQVGTPALTKLHQVQLFGIDAETDYEFVIRSTACNGATTTDTNGGEGYTFFKPVMLGPASVHASFNFDTDDQGWTTSAIDRQDPDQPTHTQWTRATPQPLPAPPPPASYSATAWNAKWYYDQSDAFLTAPAPVTFTGTRAAIEFRENHDLEIPPPELFTTSDALHVQYSTDGGSSWATAETYQGRSAGYPALVSRRVLFTNPGGPVLIRFMVTSDDNTSVPAFEGVTVDDVAFVSYSPFGGRPSTPLVGPVPPPSAGATGLTAPPTRTGPATNGDIAAGTSYCSIPQPNRAPDARDDAATVARGGSVDVDVLANDTDPDGDPLTISSFTQGTNGDSHAGRRDTLRYQHNNSATSSDSFQYTITDGRGGQDTATVRISITSTTPPGGDEGGDKANGGGWLRRHRRRQDQLRLQRQGEETGGFEGHLELNDKGAGVKIHLKQVTSLGAVEEPCGGVPEAADSLQFRGTGTYNGANASFRVCVQDGGEGSKATGPDRLLPGVHRRLHPELQHAAPHGGQHGRRRQRPGPAHDAGGKRGRTTGSPDRHAAGDHADPRPGAPQHRHRGPAPALLGPGLRPVPASPRKRERDAHPHHPRRTGRDPDRDHRSRRNGDVHRRQPQPGDRVPRAGRRGHVERNRRHAPRRDRFLGTTTSGACRQAGPARSQEAQT